LFRSRKSPSVKTNQSAPGLPIGSGDYRAFVGPPEKYDVVAATQFNLVDEGIEKELGRALIKIKQPVFDHNSEFRLRAFGRQFDYLISSSICWPRG
jgi:hypothetical protein